MVERRDVLSASNVELLAERRLRGVELALTEARRLLERERGTVAELSQRVAELEDELQQARDEPQRLRGRLEHAERARRAAEQRAHAEQARREQLQEELDQLERSGRDGDRARERLTSARRTIVELERRLAERQREVDELEHMLAAAASARSRAEQRADTLEEALTQFEAELAALEAAARERERAPDAPPEPVAAPEPVVAPEPVKAPAPIAAPEPRSLSAADLLLLRREHALAARRSGRGHPRRRAPGAMTATRAAGLLEGERTLVARFSLSRSFGAGPSASTSDPGLLERERLARQRAEATAAELERELMLQRMRSSRARSAIELLRGELREQAPPLPSAPAPLTPATPLAPAPPLASPPPAPGPTASGPVSIDRLGAALERLRAETPGPQEASEHEPALRPWLGEALRRLGRRDPAAAGRLVVELLALQRLVSSPPLRYDIELSPSLAVQLTLEGAEQRIVRAGALRALDQVCFRLRGDQKRLGRLLGARRLVRPLPWRRARFEGDARRGRATLEQLLRAPVRLGSLPAHGVALPAELSFALLAAMIPAESTRGQRFTVAHRAPGACDPDAALVIAGGRRIRVRPPAAADLPRVLITCEARSLPTVLDGGEAAAAAVGAELEGDPEALALLARWLDQAQRRQPDARRRQAP